MTLLQLICIYGGQVIMRLNLFKYKDSEKYQRNQIKKRYSEYSNEYKIKNLELDKKFKGLSDEEFDYGLINIQFHHDSQDYKLKKAELDKKYKKIDDYQYELEVLKITSNTETKEFHLKKIELDFKYEKINDTQREKAIATINGEPWFKFLETKLVGEEFSFRWDCNKLFLEALAKMGYNQPSDEDNVMEWLKDAWMHTFDEDVDSAKRDIRDFETSKIESHVDSENPNMKIYS